VFNAPLKYAQGWSAMVVIPARGLDEGARKLEEVLSYFKAANAQVTQRAALKPLD